MSRLMRAAAGLVLVWVAVAGAGCAAKLNDERSFSLPEGSEPDKLLILNAQPSDQTIKVAVTASEPVDVYVFLTKDVAEPRDVAAGDRAKKALASKTGVTQDTLTAAVPAKQEYKVLIGLSEKSKKAEGKVKITN
ncbi:hypothetical protein [Fimbriiglobus ruber]|uniref:Lipoprotein n=1 Tax=Fimbriiglobus ruber TaxID=1908690 RepID=A0A225D9U4_9BACT|nr:hypothetical protein [Fimbriiglobus ruber]OWK37743.1 hypothetical protein FRUB_06863 [Fimbriiglobus ruber]